MTKLELADWMVKKYMPWHGFDDDEPPEAEDIKAHMQDELNFRWDEEMDFKDIAYSPEAFLYFWDKFEESMPSPPVVIFRKLSEGYDCEIDGRGELTGEGSTRQEAFYRAVKEWEDAG